MGDLPLILDREFSYEGMYEAANDEGVKYIVRLNTGNWPAILDKEGDKLSLYLFPGKRISLRGVLYKGKVKGNGAKASKKFCGSLAI